MNNFGSIQIDKREKNIELKLQIRDEAGLVLQQKKVLLDALGQNSQHRLTTTGVEFIKLRFYSHLSLEF